MKQTWFGCAACAVLLYASAAAHAAFMIQIDTDGLDDGVLTYSPNFTFGGDTTTASQSVAATTFGLTGGDSIFGGDGSASPDAYVYRYDPTTDADNLVTSGAGIIGVDLLGAPVAGTGLTGGAAGKYFVYATWPTTANVSGGLTTYAVESGANSFAVQLDQNNADFGDNWVRLGVIDYDGSSGILVTQTSTTNTFVSMRAAGVLFEPAPEPLSAVLALSGVAGLCAIRRRS